MKMKVIFKNSKKLSKKIKLIKKMLFKYNENESYFTFKKISQKILKKFN